jgi:hypothetical protein
MRLELPFNWHANGFDIGGRTPWDMTFRDYVEVDIREIDRLDFPVVAEIHGTAGELRERFHGFDGGTWVLDGRLETDHALTGAHLAYCGVSKASIERSGKKPHVDAISAMGLYVSGGLGFGASEYAAMVTGSDGVRRFRTRTPESERANRLSGIDRDDCMAGAGSTVASPNRWSS